MQLTGLQSFSMEQQQLSNLEQQKKRMMDFSRRIEIADAKCAEYLTNIESKRAILNGLLTTLTDPNTTSLDRCLLEIRDTNKQLMEVCQKFSKLRSYIEQYYGCVRQHDIISEPFLQQRQQRRQQRQQRQQILQTEMHLAHTFLTDPGATLTSDMNMNPELTTSTVALSDTPPMRSSRKKTVAMTTTYYNGRLSNLDSYYESLKPYSRYQLWMVSAELDADIVERLTYYANRILSICDKMTTISDDVRFLKQKYRQELEYLESILCDTFSMKCVVYLISDKKSDAYVFAYKYILKTCFKLTSWIDPVNYRYLLSQFREFLHNSMSTNTDQDYRSRQCKHFLFHLPNIYEHEPEPRMGYVKLWQNIRTVLLSIHPTSTHQVASSSFADAMVNEEPDPKRQKI